MISPQEAWQRLDSLLRPMEPESLPRREALGRVLTAPLHATVDVPEQDISAMDGYAVSADARPETAMPVSGRVAAGDAPGGTLPAGSAMRIMTGAAVPAGADRVVPVERSDDGEQRVTLTTVLVPGANIRRGGEVVRRGDELAAAGTLLTPGALAYLATHGHETVPVHAAPRVAILTTGDEVVPPSETPAPGQLRDSHTDFLTAALATLGLAGESLGIAPDRPDELAALIARGLTRDVLLLCGGVSKGQLDFVAPTLDALGCETLFHGVSMQPGKPLLAARHDGGWLLALPGNPSSVMATFWLFGRPLLRRLMGRRDGFWHGALEGVLAAPLPGAKGRQRFLPARVELTGGTPRVTPGAPVGSHDLAASATGTALVRIAAEAEPAAAGERCSILPLADWLEG